jgi:F0F1-type ATP synthase membrane subunit b/b'
MGGLHPWIASICGLVLCILAVIGFIIKVNRDRSAADEQMHKDIREIQKDADAKINTARKEIETSKEDANKRLWERIDEIKENHKKEIEGLRSYVTEHYVDARYCELVHRGSEKTIQEMKDGHDQNIKDIKTDIQNINTKLDKLIEQRSGGVA